MRSFPIVCLLLIGCGGSAPAIPEAAGQEAARVLAVAQDLESARKSRQAMAAYRQIIQHFPDSPEAKQAARKIAEAQRAAIQKPRPRKSN